MKTVTIYDTTDYVMALSAKALLEENDIFVLMPNEYSAGLKTLNFGLGSFQLLVRDLDFDQAFEFLKAAHYLSDEIVNENLKKDERLEDSLICPFCGSSNTKVAFLSKRLGMFLFLFLAGMSVTGRKSKKRCLDCKKSWIYVLLRIASIYQMDRWISQKPTWFAICSFSPLSFRSQPV